MDNELEVIRDQMDQTRASLSDKLEVLESQVHETVVSATNTVAETVENVKDVVESVTGTVESVADTLNIAKHFEAHPWGSLLCAVATGFFGSLLLKSSPKPQTVPVPVPVPPSGPAASAPVAPQYTAQKPAEEQKSSTVETVEKIWGKVTDVVKDLALGSVLGTVAELANSALPDTMHEEVDKFLDDLSVSLGGKPLKHSPRQHEENAPAARPPDEDRDEQGHPSRTPPHNGLRRMSASRG